MIFFSNSDETFKNFINNKIQRSIIDLDRSINLLLLLLLLLSCNIDFKFFIPRFNCVKHLSINNFIVSLILVVLLKLSLDN